MQTNLRKCWESLIVTNVATPSRISVKRKLGDLMDDDVDDDNEYYLLHISDVIFYAIVIFNLK